ncbi:MAG: WYL domain-containing protein [Opitutus sp.]|nr:WYL domain-containing protein [Opitutus sp.]
MNRCRIAVHAPKVRPILKLDNPADCGRAALRRVLFIHERLSNDQPVTAASLAEELETSGRTVKRDIEFMRDQLGAPIEWDATAHTYTYSRPCDILPLLRLDAGEALALTLAGQTFAAWHGTPLGRALGVALGKIAGVIGGAISVPVSEIRHLVFHPDAAAAADDELRHFATALEAIRRRRVLRLVYQKPRSDSAPETRLVHPLHLAFLDHRWVLVAHDPNRGAPRNFLLARIRETHATAGTFTPPPDFDLSSYLRGSLGRFTGREDHLVQLRFAPRLAPYVREKPWHASQVETLRADGSLEVALRLNNLVDVRRHILACGHQVEVLAPPELRTEIAREIRAASALYAGDPP